MRFFSRTFTVFSFLLALTLLLIFLHVRGLAKPVESTAAQVPRPFVYVFSGIGNSIKSFFGYFSSVSKVNNQNAELAAQVRTLQQDNIILQQYKLENEKLKKELGYKDLSKYQLIPGTVIGMDPTGYSQAVVLNIGSNDGVRVGAAVLSEGVLVGKIITVESFTSKVLLVTDPQSNIDAQISLTGDNAIVRGSYGSGMVIDLVSQSVQLNKGDEVVTAGLNADLPKGILIGSVGELQSQKNGLFQKATVVPSTDLKNLNFVSVIK
ncbi:MAG: rod shape-determining protein MreC [Candidatus Doudnabacteria bacterium]|nr:rod shape-determining protein MreC [Candidatus Doudnabacteria bacterium]